MLSVRSPCRLAASSYSLPCNTCQTRRIGVPWGAVRTLTIGLQYRHKAYVATAPPMATPPIKVSTGCSLLIVTTLVTRNSSNTGTLTPLNISNHAATFRWPRCPSHPLHVRQCRFATPGCLEQRCPYCAEDYGPRLDRPVGGFESGTSAVHGTGQIAGQRGSPLSLKACQW